MGIVTSEVSELSRYDGAFRARFRFVLDDGRVHTRGPSRVANAGAADSLKALVEVDVLAQVQASDADDAVSQNKKIGHKQATKPQVELAWLRDGYHDRQIWRAYNKFNKVMPDLIALGLTIPGYANRLDITTAKWNQFVAFWDYMNQGQNETRIAQYITIHQGDPR